MSLSARDWRKLLLSAALLLITAVGFSRLPELRMRFSPDYLLQQDLRRTQSAVSLLAWNYQKLEDCLALPPMPEKSGYLGKIKYRLRVHELKKRAIYIKRRLPFAEAMLKSLAAEVRNQGSRSGKPPKKNSDLERILAMQQDCREYRNQLEAISMALAKRYDIHLH